MHSNSFLLLLALCLIALSQVQLAKGLKCYDCQYIRNDKKKADSGSFTCESEPSVLELTEFPDLTSPSSNTNSDSESGTGYGSLSKKSCLFENILQLAVGANSNGKGKKVLPSADYEFPVRRVIAEENSNEVENLKEGATPYCITLKGKFEGMYVTFRGIVLSETFLGDNFCLPLPKKQVKNFENGRICGCTGDGCNSEKLK